MLGSSLFIETPFYYFHNLPFSNGEFSKMKEFVNDEGSSSFIVS